ncbi:unnamed protein product [Rotaria sp. Silwood2]|nr:unnamed protein product [Rotaria sp. Silwood2]
MKYSNLPIEANSRCSPYYTLLKQSIPNITYLETLDNIDQAKNFFCKKIKGYEKIERIGRYPAIYYFGKSFGSTILTTFFTLFGIIAEDELPDRGYELVSLICEKPNKNYYASGFDLFSSNLGFVIFDLFTFICVTVLINTLIAMMGKTIDIIDDRADVEWKFARSRLYMEYIRDGDRILGAYER